MFGRVRIGFIWQQTLQKFVQTVAGPTESIIVLNRSIIINNFIANGNQFKQNIEIYSNHHYKYSMLFQIRRHILRTLLFEPTYIEMEAILQSDFREHIHAEVHVLKKKIENTCIGMKNLNLEKQFL